VRRHGAAAGALYAELQVTSNFSFLRGGSHPEELVERAALLGHDAVAVADLHTLAGVVRAHLAAKRAGIPLVVGSRLELACGGERAISVLVYPTDRAAYGRLCRLLTLGKRRASKGCCELSVPDLVEHQAGLVAVVVPPAVLDGDFVDVLCGLRGVFDDDRLSLGASRLYGPDDAERLGQLAALSAHAGVPLVATNDVHCHEPGRKVMQDVIACIRMGCTLAEAGRRLFPHGERHLKTPQEMARLFAGHAGAVARSVEIARRCAFSLDELRYQYPHEICPPGRSPMEHLTGLTWRGSAERYPRGVPAKVRAQIEHELRLIDELGYAPYFLTVHDLVVFARGRGILCQGRGAAANSAVCYCLGVTAVDPDRIDLLFERFVSRERNEPPDIDIDFEHERREEVIQYIYRKYGRDRAALTAEVITYRGRSAVREVGKALGLSLDCVDRLARSLDWWEGDALQPDRLRELGLNPQDHTVRRVLWLVGELLGFPRHLSQHVGGFVITRDPLCELVPIENAAMEDRTVIEWDKDDIDAMGMLKVDVLGLGMLTCVRKCFDLVNGPPSAGGSGAALSLHTIPPEDPAVYDMICAADTVGVFQIESRAQMSMLPRLRPRCFYDLVIEVAIVRPGPIQGNMVHPYLRRRCGQEPVTYPDEAVREVLGKTLGVPLFQEQAMRLAIVAAGFSPDEADQLRRAMAAWKRKGHEIERFGRRLIEGMVRRGYDRSFADRCFEQIKGFSEYGFPESHAASFALLVYVSAWLKKHHPAAFAAALINSQPMGFYAPAQIVRDAREHGVEVRPVDVNRSAWDCTLEEGGATALGGGGAAGGGPAGPALRLGMRLVRSLREEEAKAVAEAVERHGPFRSIEGLWRGSGVRVAALRHLAAADAFGSMGLDRQRALWEIRALEKGTATFFGVEPDGRDGVAVEPALPDGAQIPGLPPIPDPRKVIQDYAALGLSLKAHPVSFLRGQLAARGALPAAMLADRAALPHGSRAAVAGIVLVRQRPGTASGIVFMTLEDETGVANLIVRPEIYRRDRRAASGGVVVLARGTVERQGDVVHVLAESLQSAEWAMAELAARSRDFH
jgi:error-prone DNA polymerase